MATTGNAADDLRVFEKSERMTDIRNILQLSVNEGNCFSLISFEQLGTTREAIFIITLLREDGYTVNYLMDEIEVK